MCGRFVQTPITHALFDGFEQLGAALGEIPPKYNLAPTQPASLILQRDGETQVDRLHWGLLPFWAKDKKLQGSTINARIETVATKPAFRSAFKARRCLIPMAGYYEWTVGADGKKDPWFIHPGSDATLWAAGLWEERHKAQAEDAHGTFTVITGGSSGVSADIHDRMPVTIAAELAAEWFVATPDDAMAMLLASATPSLEAYRVTRAVNTPRNDVPGLLEPVEY